MLLQKTLKVFIFLIRYLEPPKRQRALGKVSCFEEIVEKNSCGVLVFILLL